MKLTLVLFALGSICLEVSGAVLEPLPNGDIAKLASSCSRAPVNLVCKVLTALHASHFCTSWLHITAAAQTGKPFVIMNGEPNAKQGNNQEHPLQPL